MRNGFSDVRGQKKREREFYKREDRNRREYRQKDLKWDGLQLRLNSGRLLATVEFDSKWPEMCRVRLPNGHLTDMVNLTRAKDAAVCLSLSNLNRHAGPVGASQARSFREAAE